MLLSVPGLKLVWVLSAEAAPLSWDASDVSSRVCAPVANNFKPVKALVNLAGKICHYRHHWHIFNQFWLLESLSAWLTVLLSFSSRSWRIISSTLHGVAGTLVSPCWTKQHISIYCVTHLKLTEVFWKKPTVIQGFSSSWEGDMR